LLLAGIYRLITIFDTKVTMKWQGTASDGTEVKGTLTIPEVSHEIICDRLSDFLVSIHFHILPVIYTLQRR
jgi:activator of HSP90 ATPase